MLVMFLLNGISISSFTFSNLSVKNTFIKLDDKLILRAKYIKVQAEDSSSSPSDVEAPNFVPIIKFAQKSFSEFKVESLAIGADIVTFSYDALSKKIEDNAITYKGNGLDGLVLFTIYDKYVDFEIKNILHKRSKVSVEGSAIYSFDDELFYAALVMKHPTDIKINMYFKSNDKQLNFASSSNEFSSISSIVNEFKLKKSISKWIVPYNKASSFKLVSAKGIYDFSDINVIKNTLCIEAVEKDVAYTFNERLEPALAPEVKVSFKKGILDIRPSAEATFKKHPVAYSDINIDFNGEHVVLVVTLDLKTQVKPEISEIIEAYDIAFPILQKSGETKVKLSLKVDLWTDEVYALGKFYIKDSDILLGGIPFHIKDTEVELNKTMLSIKKGQMAYSDMISAQINGELELSTLMGDFYLEPEFVSFPLSEKERINLVSKKPKVILHFSKNGESYIFPDTLWEYGDVKIKLDANTLRLSEKFSSIVEMKNFKFHIKNLMDVGLTGTADLSKETAKIDVYIKDINYVREDMNISLLNEKIAVAFDYKDDEAILSLGETTKIKMNKINVLVEPTKIKIKDGFLNLKDTRINVNNQFASDVSTHYKLGKKRINITAKNTDILSKEFLFIEPSFNLIYEEEGAEKTLTIDAFNVRTVMSEDEKGTLKLANFSKISKFSKFMQRYDINEGNATLFFNHDNIALDINLKNFHPLLSKDGKELINYNIKGNYKDNVLNLSLEDKLKLRYAKKGTASAQNIDFNLLPILKYINLVDDVNQTGESLNLEIKTKNCNVTLGKLGRKISADTLNMTIKKDEISANLSHGKGGVMYTSHENNISVYGLGLNDVFMNNLFKYSTFKGGTFKFNAEGTYKNLSGSYDVNGSTIKDYTVLTNTLAFFNTIPALMTFSLPGYSTEGLKMDSLRSDFDLNDSIVHLYNGYIDSKELKIDVNGTIDTKKEILNLDLNVKTDIGSSGKNIPVLGYLVFGKNNVSTMVHVTGKLSDPKVEHSVAKQAALAPYNVLKRTFLYPTKLWHDYYDDDNESNKDANKHK